MRRKQVVNDAFGSAAIKMDVQLRKLFHRPHLIDAVLRSREEGALNALAARSSDVGGVFVRAPSAQALAAGQRALERRLERMDKGHAPIVEKQEPPETVWERMQREHALAADQRPRIRLVPFALAAGRLFDPGAAPVNRASADELLRVPLVEVGAFIEVLTGQLGGKSGLVQVAVHILTYDASDRLAAARRTRADLLLAQQHITQDSVDGLRRFADMYWLEGDPSAEFAALQILMLLGDVEFVAQRYERLAMSTTLLLLAMAPTSFVWSEGEFAPSDDIILDGDIVLVDGLLPPVMRNALPEHAVYAPRSLTGAQADRRGLVATYCPQYSLPESLLSLRTEQLARRMCQAFAQPYANTVLAPIVPLLHEAEIRVDDVLFNALLPIAALEVALKTLRPRRVALVTDKLDFAQEAAKAVARLMPECEIFATVLRPGDGVSEDLGREETMAVGDLVEETLKFLQELGLDGEATDTSPLSNRPTTLFCGRPFDRNYVTDLRALTATVASSGEVHLLTTTHARAKNGKTPTLAEVMPEARSLLVWQDAEKVSRTLAGRAIPEILKDHGANVVSAILADRDERLADLLGGAEAQLRRMFERRMPAIIASAALVRRTVRVAKPSRIICLPGRDWLSRMAVTDARRRLGDKVSSFDIQTVFIGARMRYKPTTCDAQIAIETYSASLFERAFELPPSRIIIGGSPRYAASLKAARAEMKARTAGPYLVLFTASPLLERCLPVVMIVREVVAGKADMKFHVRVHPSSGADDVARLKEALAPLGARGVVSADGTLAQALASADVVVTRFSNTGLEAAMIGKDVIAADFVNEEPPVPLGTMGVAIGVKEPHALMRALWDVRAQGPLTQELRRARAAYFEQNPLLLNENSAAAMWQTILARK